MKIVSECDYANATQQPCAQAGVQERDGDASELGDSYDAGDCKA